MTNQLSLLQRYALGKAIFRKEKIVELCTNKSVLHLGYIQHSELYADLIKKDDWLHSKICEISATCIGVDYLDQDVDILRKKYGFAGEFGDVMDLDAVPIQEKFDVIVCGELIEHVENPGLMLDGIRRFMHSDSILIITTPNPWSLVRLFTNRSENRWLNDEHVSWYSHQTLRQLLDRKQYSEVNYGYYFNESIVNLGSPTRAVVRLLLLALSPEQLYGGLFFVSRSQS